MLAWTLVLAEVDGVNHADVSSFAGLLLRGFGCDELVQCVGIIGFGESLSDALESLVVVSLGRRLH